jgi:1-deoxyxylulose-5-phosphate synthase
MDYVKLGHTGLEVSKLVLGCMSYGDPDRGNHGWTLPEADSALFLHRALDAGVNFFDTANAYSDGSSEEIVGKVLLGAVPRDQVVIATKVFMRMRPGPNGAGLSRAAILTEVDNSLRRLGTDHIDLYQIHRFDPTVPLEETLQALHDVVQAGKVRYLGASSMWAWQFAKALHLQDMNGWTRFVTMQNHYNLLYREEEREMLPLCADEGIGVIPWSPLARGKLTRDWSEGTNRSEKDEFGKTLYRDSDADVVAAVARVAERRGVPRAQVALAWVAQNPVVTAPIVGATKPHHLEDALAAVDLELTDDEIAELEGPYEPHEVAGF